MLAHFLPAQSEKKWKMMRDVLKKCEQNGEKKVVREEKSPTNLIKVISFQQFSINLEFRAKICTLKKTCKLKIVEIFT